MANSRELLKALRSGTVPKEGLDEIFVGHDAVLSELTQELVELRESNISSTRFIQGDYGTGKTMLTSYIIDQALSMNYCISQIVINPMVQLGNFSQVYSAFCQNLRTPLSKDGSGMIGILESWSQRQLSAYQSIEGLNGGILDTRHINAYTAHIERELVSVRNVNPDLAHGISAFAGARVKRDNELAKYAIDWIRASDKIPTKDYAAQLGLKGKIDGDDAYNFLKGILLIIKEAGYSGTIIVLDEVETVKNLPQKPARHKAYEVLRNIIDDCATGKFFNSLFLVTGTPAFFNDRTGIKEYEALNARIKQIKDDNSQRSNKQPILELKTMTSSDLFSLAVKIRKIHGEAGNWDILQKVSDGELTEIVDYLAVGTMGTVGADPRPFIRKLIEKFDQLKEQPKMVVRDLLPNTGEVNG